jgi:endonuclease YncB( thermonuclease family)
MRARRPYRHLAPRVRRAGWRSARTATGRSSWRDSAAMALVATAFICVFAYALSNAPAPARARPPAQAQANLEPAGLPAAERIAEPGDADPSAPAPPADGFGCDNAQVTDGDTIRCGPLRVRLASIDAPEMPGHCRRGRVCTGGDPFASKANLERIIASGPTLCRQTDTDHYGRIVALCAAGGQDLSCAQVEGGFAVVRYGDLICPSRPRQGADGLLSAPGGTTRSP